MESFLKDRPAIAPGENAAPIIGTSPAVSGASSGGAPAFGQVRRETPAATGTATASSQTTPTAGSTGEGSPGTAAAAAPQDVVGEHGTRVQTIVERGRVTKIIVTCACGKVTEIACTY